MEITSSAKWEAKIIQFGSGIGVTLDSENYVMQSDLEKIGGDNNRLKEELGCSFSLKLDVM